MKLPTQGPTLGPPFPQPLGVLFFIPSILSFLDISYKWNNIIFSHLCLACFTKHNIFKVHPSCSIYWNFLPFLRLNNIPSNVFTTFLFIQTSPSGHVGCFYLLALMSSAAVGVQISLWDPAFSSFRYMYSEVGLLDHKVVLFLSFWGTSILFSMAVAPFYNLSSFLKPDYFL